MIQHVSGETCVPINPQRVINLGVENTVNSKALGIKPIGTTQIPDFPTPEYLQGKLDGIESVGNLDEPSLEKILQLQPDLILGLSYNHEKIYDQLSVIAPTVILNSPWPAITWTEEFEELAEVLDKQDSYQELMNNYWQRIEELQEALGDRRLTMQVSIANTSSEYGIWSYGEKSLPGSILADVGVQRPPAQRGDYYYIENISQEKMANIDGDVLFFVSWGREDDRETLARLQQNPLWQTPQVLHDSLKGKKKGQVC